MYNNMGNVPSLSNSNAVDQNEIQKAKQKMGNYGAAGQGLVSGAITGTGANLTSSTAIDQLEIQQAKQKVQSSGFQNTTY
ncbi:hypothetical protein FQB35_10125 [Crassaminicella thermophila]|uniref:Uncharacterized protein n=1 Tax=Crassaminicella thermophila TaxID=2599308 RepID=A0A5C0SFY4_CRATE|nr:hypothetical protein [Crassaminicella thermophila]QEK12656.1 hypothetical protein FQB35_10125 [Crassaminicella thermophila]